ncbi:MAG: tetratricopeptide repeat protein [Cyclobacteriaceae bacterium]
MNYQGSPDQQLSKRLFSGTIAVLLTALLFMASAETTYSQSPEIRKAFRYNDIEQPSKMMPALEKAVATAPEQMYYLGVGYIMKGDIVKALATFEKGISADDKDPMPVAGKGHAKLLQKKTAEGKALLAEAADMNRKKTAGQWEAIGRAYLSDTKFLLDAIAALEKAKAIDNGNPEVHMLLGDAYLMQNQGGESVSSYERAAAADPKWATPLYKVAKVYQRSRNNDIVMDYLNRAVSVDPEYAPAWKELAETFYLLKKANMAVEALEKYLKISETPGEAKFQLAFFYFMAKDYEKANAIFKEVLNSKNASPTALKFYAFSLIEQGKDLEAQKILDQFFKTAKPKDIKPSDFASYGKLLLKLKEDSLANEIFAQGIALDTAVQDIEIWELQAETYLKRRKFEKAAVAYEDLVAKREKPLSQDLYYMGSAYYFSGQYLKADSAFTDLSEKQPNMTVGYLWAAKARAQYDSTGEHGVAVPMYEKFVEKALENPEKNKKDLVDAYDYLGMYYLHKSTNEKEGLAKATEYFKKVQQLDPSNERAKNFFEELKQINNPTQGRQQR